MDSSFFFGLSTMAYILAMVAYISYLAFKKPAIGATATGITIFGLICQTAAIGLRWREFSQRFGLGFLRSVPLTNLYESIVFFIWCLMLGYLIIEFKYKNRSFGAFVTPVAVIALAFIAISGMPNQIEPLVPALQSNWLLAHVMMSFIAYSAFALAFSTGIMYLIETTGSRKEGAYIFWSVALGLFISVLVCMGFDYLQFNEMSGAGFMKGYLFRGTYLSSSPLISILSWAGTAAIVYVVWRYGLGLKRAIEGFKLAPGTLDDITYKAIAIGFPIFTLGGLIFGAIWANQAWGVYWSWDPKETWSLITWFVYAFYLHARLLRGWRGHKTAVVAVIGFIAVIFTYLGVNLLLSGLHSYGSIE